MCEWHLRRFLCASYWCWRMVLGWLVEAVLAVLPPAEDGRVLLVVDGTYKAKTARKHPLVKGQKGTFQSLEPLCVRIGGVGVNAAVGSIPDSG